MMTSKEDPRPSTSRSKSQEMDPPSHCSFCGIASTTADANLEACLFCGTVAYCSTEHQQFDWVKHKFHCKILQAQGRVNHNVIKAQTNREMTAKVKTPPPQKVILPPSHSAFSVPKDFHSQNPINMFSSGAASAFRPYSSKSNSLESLSSLSSGQERVTSPTVPPPPPTQQQQLQQQPQFVHPSQFYRPTTSQTSPKETKKETAEMSRTTSTERIVETDDPDIQIIEGGKTSVRSRKRPTPTSSVEPKPPFKDHNKNVVYSTTLQEHQKHLQSRGLALNIHQAMVLRLRYIAEHVIRSLNEFGWAVVDNFLGSDHYKYTAKEVETLYHRGLFSPGQLMEGKNKDRCHIQDIRSDHIYWFDGADERASDAATVRLLISMIDSVIQHFKQRIAHDIGGRSRAMLAIYPGSGTRYVKHVDNPVKDGRCITTIYYCNEDWDMNKDGGTLRLYPETSTNPMDIDPKADRLVFFWSDRRNPHEVMPVYRHRFAITIWYMDKEEREQALARQRHPARNESPLEGTSSKLQHQEDDHHDHHHHGEGEQSTQELSKLNMRLFPTTSSDPILIRANENGDLRTDSVANDVDSGTESSSTGSHPVAHSGPSLPRVGSHAAIHRISSLQSVSDAFVSERTSERRSSTSSDNDLDDLPPPPEENPEYII